MRHQFAPVLNRLARAAYVFGVSFLLVGIVLSYMTQPASAADIQGETKRCKAVKIDVCHHTSSASNPYEIISVNINSVDDGLTAGGHLTHSKVPFVLFESDAWDSYEYCGVTFPAFGDQDLVANHCVYAPPTETQTLTQTETITFTPPTETQTQTQTETETQTQTETLTTTFTPPTETQTQTQTETITQTETLTSTYTPPTETLTQTETETQTQTQTQTETVTVTITETLTETLTETITQTQLTETQGPPTITATDPIQTQTEEQTLPPPPANITPVVLIPVTGVTVIQPAAISYSMAAKQSIFLNLGLILLGFGLAFHSLAKKFTD